MNPTQTGIATALALVVVAIFFILPAGWFFGGQSVAVQDDTASGAVLNNSTTTEPMPTLPTGPVTELMIQDQTVGTGATAAAGDVVTVHYVGALTNGTVFDASRPRGEEGFAFTLGTGQVIKGWDQGVAGMKVGGKRVLVIPASLAYGDQAVGGVIPAGSTLVFEVELLSVQKKTQ